MKKRRLLAWLMTLVMMIGLMPATALADSVTTPTTTVTNDANSAAKITKSVGNQNATTGYYPITIDAYVTGTVQTTSPNPLDIVLVLDASTSMRDPIDGDYIEVTKTWKASDLNHSGGVTSQGSGYYHKVGNNYYQVSVNRNDRLVYNNNTVIADLSGNRTYTGTLYSKARIEALKVAVKNFIDVVAANAALATESDHRISIVKYNATSEVLSGLVSTKGSTGGQTNVAYTTLFRSVNLT